MCGGRNWLLGTTLRMAYELNQCRLQLATCVEARDLPDGTRLLKHTRRGEYLALDHAQQRALNRFDGQSTVQQILFDVLTHEPKSSIRDFYVLTIEALQAGFLTDVDATDPGEDEQTLTGHTWSLRWGFGPALGSFLLFMPIGWHVFTAAELALPQTIVGWLVLLLLVALTLSLANALAGCVLAGFGRQVYSPGIRFELGIPFFCIDTRDGFMGGRLCQAAVALQTLSVPFMVAVVGCLLQDSICILSGCIAALYLTSPFGSTPAHNLLHALFRRAYHLPLTGSTFLTKKALLYLVRFGTAAKEGRYLLTYSAYAVAWLGLLIIVCNRVVRRQWDVLVKHLVFAPSSLAQAVTLVAAVLLFCLLLAPLVCELWVVLRNAFELLSPVWFRAETATLRRRSDQKHPGQESIVDFLREILLFAHLSEEDRRKVAEAMIYAEVKGGTDIVREGDHGDVLFVIYSGRTEVLKDDDTGTARRVATLEAGDVFGEIALLKKVPRTATVRSLGPAGLLVLERDDFEPLLLEPLGAERIATVIQVCSFLKRNPMFAEWPDKALLAFACEFSFRDYGPGDVAIKQEHQNDTFFLIYEGACEVRRSGERLNVLSIGDFFGEISLLRGTPAVADVIASEPCRCLCLDRTKFLQFVTRDALTGLAVERTMEERVPEDLPT